MTLLLGIALGFLGFGALVAFLFATAPVGYEDECGFHRGKPRDDASHQGTDGGAASGSQTPFHSTTDSPGGEHGHVIG
jgi:hypothetical protein